jgi:hypothetical protein
MAARLVLLVGCVLPAAGCLDNGYSSTPHPLPAASEPVATAPTPEAPPEESPVANNAAPAVPAAAPKTAAPAETVAEASPPAANKLLPTKDITFDDIKFDIEKDAKFERSLFTPAIEELNGRSIRIRGYILPTFQQSGIRNFVLVRDNMECCFGPGAAIYDCIIVDMIGATAEFTTRPVTVEGVLTFREVLDFDGITRAIYHLDAVSVK